MTLEQLFQSVDQFGGLWHGTLVFIVGAEVPDCNTFMVFSHPQPRQNARRPLLILLLFRRLYCPLLGVFFKDFVGFGFVDTVQ